MATYDRILAFAVATGQTATVFVVSGKLMDWQMWREVTASPTRTRSELRVMIATLNPTLIISEDPDGPKCRKRGKSLELLRDMGFGDNLLNRDILAACDYDAQRAVALLCGDDAVSRNPGAA